MAEPASASRSGATLVRLSIQAPNAALNPMPLNALAVRMTLNDRGLKPARSTRKSTR